MIEIGRINTLTVLRETAVGLYLGDEDKNEVLLPASQVKSKYNVDDKLSVFIYTDSEGRLIASTGTPVAHLNHFTCLRVTAVTEVGAFMDWGLEKDLFVPFSEQKYKMEEEKYYVVFVHIDEVTNRIVASSKIEKFISNDHLKLETGQEVEVLLYEESPLGFSCIINESFKGLIYHNDIYKDVFIGDEFIAYVKTIRDDNLVDISFQKSGFQNVLSSTDIILDRIIENNGFLALSDKSTPEEIAREFRMSKATFKKAIGILYRHRKVLIKPDGVYLAKAEDQEVPGEEPKGTEPTETDSQD